jgi:predicted PurR-regulated permease PerM
MAQILDLSARQRRAILWIAVSLLVAGVIWAARSVLLPYILGLVLAYLLLPLVNWLDRHIPRRLHTWGVARPLAIVVTYLLVIALVAGIVAFFVPLIADQVNILIQNWPQLTSRVQDWGSRGRGWYNKIIDALQSISPTWKQTVETGLQNLAADVLATIQSGLVATVRTVSSTISFIIGGIIIPFWLFYILHDESQVKTGVLRAIPQQLRADVECMARLIDDVLSAYIRGQLLLMLFVGGMATIALFIIGVPFALVLGLVAGIFEALPFVGPILGAIPAVLVALLSDPISALWVAVSFFAIQQVENLILVPRIAGESVKLHPAMVMVVLVIGNELAGFLGMLVAVPVTAVLRDVFKYLYLRLLDDPLSPEAAMANIRSGKEVQLGV